MGAWESKRWEPKRIGDGAVDNEGVLGGSPGEEVVATLEDWVRKETGEEGGNKNKCGQSSSLICNARY